MNKYNFITQAYEYGGKTYYRKHKTENQMKKYIKELTSKKDCIEAIFCYQYKNGVQSNNPMIIDYRNI
jgi:hypothetical protein